MIDKATVEQRMNTPSITKGSSGFNNSGTATNGSETPIVFAAPNDSGKEAGTATPRTNLNELEAAAQVLDKIESCAASERRPYQWEPSEVVRQAAKEIQRLKNVIGVIEVLANNALCDVTQLSSEGRQARRVFEKISKLAYKTTSKK